MVFLNPLKDAYVPAVRIMSIDMTINTSKRVYAGYSLFNLAVFFKTKGREFNS